VALELLAPAAIPGALARQVLAEVLALRRRPVRIQALLILFWRLVWEGEQDQAPDQVLLRCVY